VRRRRRWQRQGQDEFFWAVGGYREQESYMLGPDRLPSFQLAKSVSPGVSRTWLIFYWRPLRLWVSGWRAL